MHKIEEWSYNYVKMDCRDKDRCYGVLAVSLTPVAGCINRRHSLDAFNHGPQVHRITFALALFHFILGLLLIGVKDTRTPRAAIQNG